MKKKININEKIYICGIVLLHNTIKYRNNNCCEINSNRWNNIIYNKKIIIIKRNEQKENKNENKRITCFIYYIFI